MRGFSRPWWPAARLLGYALTLRPVRLLAPLRRIRPGFPSPRELLLPGFRLGRSPFLPLDITTTRPELLLLAVLTPARTAAILAAPDPSRARRCRRRCR